MRLPFDPDRVSAPPPPPGVLPGANETAALTVSELSSLVKSALAQALPAKLRVVGEVSNFSSRTHWFFSLKDAGATLRCVCFASAARRVGFDLKDGMQVVCTGRVDYYESYGHLQLYVDAIEPVGQGALELKFRALCEELRQAGYFDEARKKPLPVLPRRMAVVTSRGAAALQDVINTAKKRWAGCHLLLFDVRVQGEQAAPEIAAALDALSQHGEEHAIDAIILTRGGGAIEDLWAFNERIVADAVYRCALPIVAAIGHETDTTIAELTADLRCSTPTQAVMALVPDRKALDHQVDQLAHRLGLMLKRSAQHNRQRLEAAARHPLFRKPGQLVDAKRQQLEMLGGKLATTLPRLMASRRDKLEALRRQLEAVGPGNVLRRGYTYTLGKDGHVLRSADDVKAGEHITTVLADGRVVSRVEGGDGETGDDGRHDKAKAPPKRGAGRGGRARSGGGEEGRLF